MRRTGWVIAVLGCCLLVGALVIQAMAQDAVVTQARPGIQAKMLTDQELDQVAAGRLVLPPGFQNIWDGMKLVGMSAMPMGNCQMGCTINAMGKGINANFQMGVNLINQGALTFLNALMAQ